MSGPLRVERGNWCTWLALDDRHLCDLECDEAAAIEAQLAGGTLRIVDVGGTGLPKWPDLTELRAAVDAVYVAREKAAGSGAKHLYRAVDDACYGVVRAAAHLIVGTGGPT